MSLHKSLKARNKLARARNVLKRQERIERLETEERWALGQSVFGLAKVQVKVRSAGHGKKKAAEAEVPAAEAGAGSAAEDARPS